MLYFSLEINNMGELYKQNGEWFPSEWKDGQKHVNREDGHTYTYFESGEVGHVHCDCFHD